MEVFEQFTLKFHQLFQEERSALSHRCYRRYPLLLIDLGYLDFMASLPHVQTLEEIVHFQALLHQSLVRKEVSFPLLYL